MRALMGYMLNMLPYMLISLPVVLGVRISLYLSRRRLNLWHEAGVVAFYTYLVGLASQTVIPKFELGVNGLSLVLDRTPRINLIPLRVFFETWQVVLVDGYFNYFVVELIANIAMFVVIGFMLPLLWSRYQSLKLTLFTCFVMSVSIEVIQLILPRATDIDDVLMNTLGGLLGFLLYRRFAGRLPRLAQRFRPIG